MQCNHEEISPHSYIPAWDIFTNSFTFICNQCKEEFDSNQFNLPEFYSIKTKIKRQIKDLKTISKRTYLSYDEVIPKYNLYKLMTSDIEELIENIKRNKFSLKYFSNIRPDFFVKISNKEDLILIEWGSKEKTYLSTTLSSSDFLEFRLSLNSDLNFTSVYSLLLELKDLI